MLTKDRKGLHFSVQANGRRPTDAEVDEAIRAHEGGRWVPTSASEKLMDITPLRDELGDTVNPWVRQFVQPWKYAEFAAVVARRRAGR